MEYLQELMNSQYFEPIKDSNHFEKKIQKLIDQSKIVHKKPQEVICEYGSKSNFIYFVISGNLAVFIPKNESDLNKQFSLFSGIEKCKRQLNRDPLLVEVQEKLQKLQAEWASTQQKFNSELINNLKQYQICLKPSVNGQEEDFYLEKRKQTAYQTSSFLKKEVCSMKKVGEMKGGDCFGEIGAILDKPRTATIIAIEQTTCLVVSFKKYQEIFSQEQIFELNFRVLNLSQIFSEKSVETDVVAHLATHFYKVPQSHLLYREGDKVDGIYLIHNGHVEIFRTQKEYFNSQISIIIKGKGSLIGLEDYFEFDQNSLILNHANVKINDKKNGRRYSAFCKDKNMKVYKIDKGILDYFVEGYSHFRNYFKTLAHQKFIEYQTKYQKNVELKTKISNLSIVQIQSSQQKINKNQSLNIQENQQIQNQIDLNQNGGEIKNHQDIQQGQQHSDNAYLRNLAKKIYEDQITKKQSIDFPEMIRYENSKIKDFQQVYEITMKRNKRPPKQDSLSSAKYDAFIKNKFDQHFINHLEHEKKKYENDIQLKRENRLKKQNNNHNNNGQDYDDESDTDKEFTKNKDNIDFITRQNQSKSMKYIQWQSSKIKTDKSYHHLDQDSSKNISHTLQDDEETNFINNNNHNNIILKNDYIYSQNDYIYSQNDQDRKNYSKKYLFKYKSMNFIPNQDDSFQMKTQEDIQNQNDLEDEDTSINKQNSDNQTKEDIVVLKPKSESVCCPIQSLQKIDLLNYQSGKRMETLISDKDSLPLLSNPEMLYELQSKTSSNLAIPSEKNIHDNSQSQRQSSNALMQSKVFESTSQQELFQNSSNKISSLQKIHNFQLQQDRSGKKVILKINKRQLDSLDTPNNNLRSTGAAAVQLAMDSKRKNSDNIHSNSITNNSHLNNNNNTSLHSIQLEEPTTMTTAGGKFNNKSSFKDSTFSQSLSFQSPIIKNNNDNKKQEFSNFHESSIFNKQQDQFQLENTPQSIKEQILKQQQKQNNSSLFLPKINGSNFISSTSTMESCQQNHKISPFISMNQQISSLVSPPRHKQAKSNFIINHSTQSLRKSEIYPLNNNNENNTNNTLKQIVNSHQPKLPFRHSECQFEFNFNDPHINNNEQTNNLKQQSQDLMKNLRNQNPNVQFDYNKITSFNDIQNNEENQIQNKKKFFYSQSQSKRESIQAQSQVYSAKNTNRHSLSMLCLEQDNNNNNTPSNQIFQNQSMVSNNLYNSCIQSSQDDDFNTLQGNNSTSKKIKLRNYLNPNQVFNIHTSNLNYSKPTQHLRNIHLKEQIMEDIHSRISLFPTKKKGGSFHKDNNKNEYSQSPQTKGSKKNQQQQQHLDFTNSMNHAVNQQQQQQNKEQQLQNRSVSQGVIDIEKIKSKSPQRKQQNNQSMIKSPQNYQNLYMFKYYQNQMTSPKKQLAPSQITLLQKQSKSPGNYISNLFTNKISSGQI